MKVGQMVQFAVSQGRQGRIVLGKVVSIWGQVVRVRSGRRVFSLDKAGVFPL